MIKVIFVFALFLTFVAARPQFLGGFGLLGGGTGSGAGTGNSGWFGTSASGVGTSSAQFGGFGTGSGSGSASNGFFGPSATGHGNGFSFGK